MTTTATTSETTPATTPTANPIHELFPYLRTRDTGAAIAFYIAAFGATERFRLVEPSGRIGHAELQVGPAVLMLSDAFPEYGLHAPGVESVDDGGRSIHLHVANADTFIERAVAAGATLISPPKDEFYGERGGKIRDPFGHVWLIGHSIEDVTPEEMQRRYTAMLAG